MAGLVKIHTDGAARGNPGPAGIGFTIVAQNGDVLAEESGYIGIATNNVAEYKALIRALEKAREFEPPVVMICSDSELMVRQLKGEYRVKSPELSLLFERVKTLLRGFSGYKLEYVPREMNRRADELANRGINEAQKAGEQPAG